MNLPSWGGRRTDERGATAAEYALLIALIAVAVLSALTAVGTSVSDMWQESCTKVAAVTTGGSC